MITHEDVGKYFRSVYQVNRRQLAISFVEKLRGSINYSERKV